MCQSGPPFRGRIGDERTICALRSGHGAGPPRLEPELRPAFRRNGAKRGMRRASRGLGEGGRTGSRGQKRAYVRSPARRGPFPALRLAHGPFLASPPRLGTVRAVPRPDRPGSNPAWWQHPASPCETGCCHSANPSSGVVARFPRSPPIGNPIGGIRTRGPAAKRGASQGPAISGDLSRGDWALGPPVPPSIGAGWRETDYVPIGGPEKALFWLGTEHMRTSGPAPRSALLR